MRRIALLAALALAACAPEPENPFERELGPPPGEEPVYRKHVNVTVGSHGAHVGGGVSRTKGNFTIGVGF